MNIKLSAWYFLHDKPKFWNDIRRKLHILKLEESQYYPECERFYSGLDVIGKIVIDVGCDFGTTPMYFLRKGAFVVFGFSKEKQYFHDFHYIHYKVDEDPLYSTTESLPILTFPLIMQSLKPRHAVLKSDCEGCEWNFTKEFIETFDDWVIAVHTPITNESLYQYIKDNGENIGNQRSGKDLGVEEIGIYRKKGKQ